MLITKGGCVGAMAEAGVWPFSHDATGSRREREGQYVFRSSTKKDPKTANTKKPAVSGQHNNDDYGN